MFVIQYTLWVEISVHKRKSQGVKERKAEAKSRVCAMVSPDRQGHIVAVYGRYRNMTPGVPARRP